MPGWLVKSPPFSTGQVLGECRESRRSQARSIYPSVLLPFTHSLRLLRVGLFPGRRTPTPRWPVAGLRSGNELKAGHGETTEPGPRVIAVALVDVHHLIDLAEIRGCAPRSGRASCCGDGEEQGRGRWQDWSQGATGL